MSAAQHFLDQAHSIARIDVLAAESGRYAELLAAEVPAAATLAELEARDALFAAALERIDAAITRVMRIRLDHALADDTSIGQPTRNVFAQTIASYANNLSLLTDRARDVAARGRAADPARVADAVFGAARTTLALRDAVRAGVLALARDLSEASVADANARARDRTRDDAERKKWSAMRRELEALSADPTRIGAAPMAARLATWPDQLDEPAPEREVTFADMIEID